MSTQSSTLMFVVPAVAAAIAVVGVANRADSHAACVPEAESAELSLESVEVDGQPVDNPDSRDYDLTLEATNNDPNWVALEAVRSSSGDRFVQQFAETSDE